MIPPLLIAALLTGSVSGRVTDPQGKPATAVTLRIASAASGATIAQTDTDQDGRFVFPSLPQGAYNLSAVAPGLAAIARSIAIRADRTLAVNLQFVRLDPRSEIINVTADLSRVDIEHPDPAEQVHVRDDLLNANPGRPGVPVSIPGVPAETASGGIKAPQYFAPGIAGDHGEPIAQFFQVGSYLLPNNLSANAHGNGYADPNPIIPAVIDSVDTDGGAFNVLEGDHSVDLAATYGLRQRLTSFVTLTADYRDVDLAAGWSPAHPATRAWLAVEASYGNGFLDALEHRQQYKVNGFRVWDVGRHELTLFGLGYYGQSKVPGLVPIGVPDLHDTIDARQRDRTHTAEAALNDIWRIGPASELQLSTFFRTYNLSLYSNFGDGLIRQSEFRTVAGDNATYIHRVSHYLSIMSGIDYLREAPRRLDLDHYESINPAIYGPFQKVTANDVTMNFLTPFVALDGRVTPWLCYYVGWRRDQVDFDNTDLLTAANSYRKWVGVNSPKATLSFLPPASTLLPSVSFSFGQAFFTNDPRIGSGTAQGTLVSRAHAYQMVVSRTIKGTELRVTLAHVTQEQTLAKIDPDTGLQFNEGPSRNRYITVVARHRFAWGLLESSVSKADARGLTDGLPLPEAPRLIVDLLGAFDRLPWRLHVRAEFEEVGRTPLGDGFTGVPVREFRGALERSIGERLEAGVNFLIASGYTGQTTEVLALTEQVVGVYLPSYAAVSLSYRLGRSGR